MRRTGIALGLLALVAAAAATWAALRAGEGEREANEAVEHHAEAPEETPPPVTLKGRSDAEASAPPAAPEERAVPGATPAPAVVDLAEAQKARLLEALKKRWTQNAPKDPKRPHHPDPDLGDPSRRARIPRHDLLGRPVAGTGPWLPDGRELLVNGMVEVVTEGEEGAETDADEEIEDPLVTAVVGRVRADGAPLSDAVVILYSSFYLRHARYDHHVREVGRAITDGDGVFDLRPIGIDTVHFGADGEVLLTIHREGYGSIVAKRLDNLLPEQENDLGEFTLSTDAASLSGTIRNLRGEPVVGAAVRVSGSMNPVIYDKTERMVVLKDCPTAVTDEEGAYRLEGFAPGPQMVSIHVNIDCVLRLSTTYPAGEHTWSPRVLAGGSVTGRVIDGNGHAVANAVVSGGSNWTPSNADGTYWLDNIQEGPFTLEVFHHAFRHVTLPDVVAGTEDLEIVMTDPLPRIRLRVTAQETGAAIPIVAIDWTFSRGGPSRFVPISPFWHAKDGVVEVIVPENASTASISAEGREAVVLEAEKLRDGLEHDVSLPLAK